MLCGVVCLREDCFRAEVTFCGTEQRCCSSQRCCGEESSFHFAGDFRGCCWSRWSGLRRNHWKRGSNVGGRFPATSFCGGLPGLYNDQSRAIQCMGNSRCRLFPCHRYYWTSADGCPDICPRPLLWRWSCHSGSSLEDRA